MQQAFPESPAYTVYSVHRLTGTLNQDSLRMALAEVVRRYDILRTTFTTSKPDPPVQVIHGPFPVELPVTVIAGGSADERLKRMRELVRSWLRLPFNLDRGVLFAAELFQMGEKDSVFLFRLHRLIADQESLQLLMGEMYATLQAGKAAPSVLPVAQYAEFFSTIEESVKAHEKIQPTVEHQEQVAASEPVALPVDRKISSVPVFEAGRVHAALPDAVAARLTRFAREHDTTLFMVLVTAFAALLARYSAQEDFLIFIEDGRRAPDLKQIVGPLVRTLSLHADMSGDHNFVELLNRFDEALVTADRRPELPLDELTKTFAPGQNIAQKQLTSALVSLSTASEQLFGISGLAITEYPVDPVAVRAGLAVEFIETHGNLEMAITYSTALFEQSTVDRLYSHFMHALTAIAENGAVRFTALPLAGAEEIEQLITWGRASTQMALPAKNLHQLFEERAMACPEAPALAFGEHRLTYGELNRRANRLAHRLRSVGVGPEVVVAIYAWRSLNIVVGMLAILKAGGAYLPLDPEHPAERLAFILQDAQAQVLLTAIDVPNQFPEHLLVASLNELCEEFPEHDPKPTAAPEDLAYVIYTSGSTGKPKGVMVEHRSVVGLCRWAQDQMRLSPGEVISWAGAPGFDVSVFEVWPALLSGARIEILNDSRLKPEDLRDWIVARQLTITQLVAPLVEGLLDLQWPENSRLRLIGSGGDRLHKRPRPELPFELHNNYGPTEVTVLATSGAVKVEGERLPSIGRPIWNRHVYVLDSNQEPVPEQVVGELYVGGPGLARGYISQPAQTADRFQPDPRGELGSRRYKTGDLAFWRNGELHFVGRADQQIKLRGYRIELGEIEAVLEAQPGVNEAVVKLVHQKGDISRLVAYVVPTNEIVLDLEELKASLGRELPDYMTPAIVLRKSLPRTATGKVDRSQLTLPQKSENSGILAPRNELEQIAARVWAQVLGLDEIDVRDDFFVLGGHSLAAMQAAMLLQRELGIQIRVRALFDNPTVETLVAQELAVRQPIAAG